jgi:modulator of FtsH protease HflC
MRKHIGMMVLAVLVLLFLVAYTVSVRVSQLSDLVVVTTFGKTTRVLSGRDPNQAGLHFKWLYPIQEVVPYDARTYLMEDSYEQSSTSDSKNVMSSVFCAWRIEDANRFLSSIKTVEAAQGQIKNFVREAKNQAIGRRALADLVNTEPARMKLADVEADCTGAVSAKLRGEFGIGVVMIGIKRLGLSESVTATVIDTMKSERQAKAAEYTASGEASATAIRERAQAAREKILAFGGRKALEIRGQGEGASAEYLSKFSGNEPLAAFLRSLEALRKGISSRTILVMDESNPLVKVFRTPPTVEGVRAMTTSQPSDGANSGK